MPGLPPWWAWTWVDLSDNSLLALFLRSSVAVEHLFDVRVETVESEVLSDRRPENPLAKGLGCCGKSPDPEGLVRCWAVLFKGVARTPEAVVSAFVPALVTPVV
jgi:hypothetical protein